MFRRLGLCLAVCLGLVSRPARSGESLLAAPGVLSLQQARDLAFLNNWDLLAAKSDVSAAQAQRLVAREFPNPTLALSSSKINLDHGSGTFRGNSLADRSYDSIVAVSQLFEIGGKRVYRRASAESVFSSAEAKFQDARRLLDLGVVRAYVLALQSETNARMLQRSAAGLRQEADIATTRQSAGDISTADRAQIEVAAARLEQDAQAAATTALTSKIALENLLGATHPAGTWEAADSLETLAKSGAASLQSAPLALVEQRPDVVAAEQFRRHAEAEWHLQRALRIPDPTVTVQYEHEPPDTLDSIGFGLSFPLPLWNQNRGNINNADAARQQAAALANKIRAEAVAEVLAARAVFEDAKARYERYRSEIAPKSAQVQKTVAYAYSKGGATLLDLLSAERTDNEVRLATSQAAADAANAAASLRAVLNAPAQSSSP